MKTRLLLALALLAGLAAPVRAGFNFTWGGYPTSVASGASYSVSVSAFFAPSSPSDTTAILGLYKDGLQVGGTGVGAFTWGGSSGTFSEPGPQTVSFSADAFSYFGETGYSSGPTVTIAAPPVETWTPFDEPQAWVYGTWAPDPSTVWEDQTFTQTRTNTRVHNTGERSNLGNTRNLGSYTESATETQTVQGTKPLNGRIVSFSDVWGPWSGSAPAETADNPPWSWSSWSPSPGWYWEDQPPTTTTQTRTGSRTVTFTTGSYTQTRTGTHTDNWTNDRGNTWTTTSGLSGSQTISSSTRTEAQSTSDSQTVGNTPRALNSRHVLSTGADQDFSAWSPDTSTVAFGQAFTQSRTFRHWLTDYWTNDRGDVWNDVSSWESSSTTQPAIGTGAVPNTAPTSSLTGSTTLTALESGTWNFSAADVDGNLSQWRFYNSTNPGAAYSPITTGASVSGTHTQSFATAGPQTWKLDVMDADGATVTKTLAVTVNPAPQAAVTLTPATASVTAGGSATFTASGGSGTGAYTWGGAASGIGATKTVSFPTAGISSVTVYRAASSGYNQSNTASASITVGNAPVITSPLTADALKGVPFRYDITATNSPTSFGANNAVPGVFFNSPGFLAGTPSQTGTYAVNLSATNAEGTGTATLTVNVAFSPITISAAPGDRSSSVGQSTSFSVAASGTAPLSYQWFKNGAAIAGATSVTYTISSVLMSHAGDYTVTVSNAEGSVTTAPATLTVVARFDPTVDFPLVAPIQAELDESILVGGTVSDQDGDLDDVTARWDGLVKQQWTNLNTGIADRYTLMFVTGTAGQDSIFAMEATDSAYVGGGVGSIGFARREVPVLVLGPNDPPETTAASASVVSASQINLTGSAADSDGNLAYLNFFISYPPDHNGYELVGSTAVSGGSATDITFFWQPPSALPDGTYFLWVKAQDAAGEVDATGAVVSFTVGSSGEPSVTPSVQVGAAVVPQGQNALVDYQAAPSSASVIGLFRSSDPDSAPVSQVVAPNAGDGQVTFGTAALILGAGYNARLFSGAIGTTKLATSNNFTVGENLALEVVNGTGGAAGLQQYDRRTIVANPPPAGQAFAGWTHLSGPGGLGNPAAPTTTFVMLRPSPEAPTNTLATVQANFAATSAPVITSQPQSIARTQYQSSQFFVTATGAPPPTYQWQKNGVAIPGATLPFFVLNSTQLGDAGTYTVAVSNAHGQVISSPATLTVDGFVGNTATGYDWGTIWASTDPGTPAATTGVGTLAGDLSVDSRGAAGYSLPLKLPPGRGGMEPSLSLNYSSAGGNGPLGIGWSLGTGLPQAITRGRSILARDGEVRGVGFDANDKYYLDGKRLLLVSGTYGQPGSSYRTEVDSFVTVTATGTGANIETFVVHDQQGRRFTFGQYAGTTDGYQMGVAANETLAYAYALKHVEDAIGHALDLTYVKVTTVIGATSGIPLGEYVLSNLRYTANPAQGVPAKAEVRFLYNIASVAGSTDRTDKTLSFIGDRQFASTRRLDAVEVVFDSVRVAYYTLGYAYAPNHGPTRLTQVKPYLRDGVGSSFTTTPATTFAWTDSTATYTTQANQLMSFGPVVSANATDGGTSEYYAFADVNGDGRDDLVDARGATAIAVSLSNGSGFGAPTAWTAAGLWTGPHVVMKLGDIDGDGRKDIVYGQPRGSGAKLYALRSTGSSFVPLGGGATATEIFAFSDEFHDPPPAPANNGGQFNIQTEEKQALANRIATGDFTGDGRDDLLIHRYDGKLKLLKSTGAGFDAAAPPQSVGARSLDISALFSVPSQFTAFPEFLGYRRWNDFSVTMIPCNLNGDGLTDYAWVESTNRWADWAAAGLGSGTNANGGKEVWAVTSLPEGGFSERTLVGIRYWGAATSTLSPYRNHSYAVMPGDVNGDGLTDFLLVEPAEQVAGEGGWSGTQQLILRHTLMLSTGSPAKSGASGAPQFKTVDAGITPWVTVAGQQVRPWFDKISIGNWVNDKYQSIGPFANSASQGSILFTLGLSSSADNVTLQDLNHDGRQDYVWYVDELPSPGWWVVYSDGVSFSSPVAAPLNWNPTVKLSAGATSPMILSTHSSLELNGDGIPDFAYFAGQSHVTPGVDGFHVSQGVPGVRLASVTNGLGRATAVAYKPLTDDSVYTPGAAVTYPIRDLRDPTYVVADVWHDTGTAATAQFSYQYSGNRLDLSGRGALGFHAFVTLDRQTNLFKYQFLTQSFPMTGLTHREETYRHWDTGNFRFLSSHDNTVVFDRVAGPAGTLWPFISRAVESRWEDAATPHFSFGAAAPTSQPEALFPQAKPGGAHITITAQSTFDNQLAPQLTLPGVTGYQPSDFNGSANTVGGTLTAAATFSGLPGALTFGNLRQLATDFGGGFTETVATTYQPGQPLNGVLTLTNLPETVTTTVTSPGYGTETAPVQRFTYQPGQPLVATAMVDATDNALDLTTTYSRDGLGRITGTRITNLTATGAQAIGDYPVSSATAFDPNFDLPTTSFNAAPYLHQTTTAWHGFLGLPVSVTDVNGVNVATQYDALGRTVGVTRTVAGQALATATAYVADTSQTVAPPGGVGGLTLTSAYRTVTTTTVQPTVTTWFDRLGRPLRTGKSGFNGQQLLADTCYNLLGQVVATSLPYPSGGVKFWTTSTYDALGRVATITAPNGTVTTQTYQGRATTVSVDAPALGGVNPAAQANTTLVDAKGRTVKVWNADNPPGTLDPVTGGTAPASLTFALDGFGRMRATTLKDQAQPLTATYDALGRQTSLSDPDKGAWAYLNNALGQVVTQTDARSNATTSTFDRLGRPLSRVTAGGGATETANFHYYDMADDPALHLVASGTMGWIGAPQREEADTTGAPGFDAPATVNLRYYNAQGLPELELAQAGGQWFYTHQTYDSFTRLQEVRHYWRPPGFEAADYSPFNWQDYGWTYAYDPQSYLLALTDTSGRLWWDQPAYDHLDRITSVRKGSGHTTVRTYRPEDGVVTAINTGASQIQNLTFAFDGLGNLTSRTGGGGAETFGYDNLNRLTTRNGATLASYSPSGNITSKIAVGGQTVGSYIYDPNKPHAVASVTFNSQITNLSYDLNGNLSTRSGAGETWNLNWTGFDKPRWMAKTAGASTVGSEFHYNANRSRVMQLEFDAMAGGVPSHYTRKRLYGLGPTVEANYNNTAASGAPAWQLDTVRVYVSAPDGIVGTREFKPNAPGGDTEKLYVYHHDHLGSIESITPFGSTGSTLASDTGGKSGRFSEDAWGQRRDPLDWSGVPVTTDDGGFDGLTPRGFTGHEMLDDLGLVHMNGRIYDPLLGRMLSADLIVEFPGSLQSYNRYSYVRNNPLTATDASGFAENTYATMTDAATAMHLRGNSVGAFFTVLGQQVFQMASLGTFSKNSAVAGQVGVNQMSVGEGAVRMGANTAIAATAATAAVVTGGASAAVIGGSGLAAGAVGGAVAGFSAGAVQTGGDTAMAAATGERVPTMGENAQQIAASTAVGAVGGALVGGAAAIENRVASAAPQAAENAVVRGGAGPVLQGQAGVARAIGQIEGQGGTILGREITLQAGAVRTRPDLFVRTADGRTIFVEVKNGPGAALTPNQTAGFPVIRGGGAIPRGGNAAGAGLPVGQPLPPTPVEVIHFP